jgi:hypothetical protein
MPPRLSITNSRAELMIEQSRSVARRMSGSAQLKVYLDSEKLN